MCNPSRSRRDFILSRNGFLFLFVYRSVGVVRSGEIVAVLARGILLRRRSGEIFGVSGVERREMRAFSFGSAGDVAAHRAEDPLSGCPHAHRMTVNCKYLERRGD